MKLIDPTEVQLNEAFAVHVAGWKRVNISTNPSGDIGVWLKDEVLVWGSQPLGFTTSADAVLPFVDSIIRVNNNCGIWTVTLHFGYTVTGPSKSEMKANDFTGWAVESAEKCAFAKALVIALLRSKGVEIEFSK